eukprot:comp21852_c1_seq1/m.31223 comp21852_c1_seq1/g.31223  ORF comp21852_c1_seq1/g.31223 comp21852_c1_seq1/m.31223 type:complete len:722 (-) comp21852_c1_seq1:271-2436(-)
MSKKISEEKLKAFSVGRIVIKKSPFELEKERREAKKREEELAAAKVFEEFVGEFQEPAAAKPKTFVRGDVIVPTVLFDQEDAAKAPTAQGELYTLDAGTKKEPKQEATPFWAVEKEPEKQETKVSSKKAKPQKMSNLEAMKEKLKKEQEEREMRQALKKMAGIEATMAPLKPITLLQTPTVVPMVDEREQGHHFSGDTTTTNIYVGNLHPTVSEEQLCALFGAFGPLASVKVMWPRTPEEHARGRNCGFVAFMTRPDAERAMDTLNGQMLNELDLRLGWGKGIPLPPVPFYVHPTNAPPDPVTTSSLPFNARKKKEISKGGGTRDYGMVAPPTVLVGDSRNPDKELMDAEIYVVMPQDTTLRRLIHKVVEYVVSEGPSFEGLIMHKEYHNPTFRFLFDNTTPEHVYYRWKLFSILQGDKPHEWKMGRFRMFRNGSWWIPPNKVEEAAKKGQLTTKDRDELESILRYVQMDRPSIRNAMGFCIDHSEAAEEIVECVTESLSILETPIPTKIARFFVVSDLLHNTTVQGASFYRKGFEQTLPEIMKHMGAAFHAISGRMRAEYFKKHVLNVLSAWEQWFLYPNPFLESLRETFFTSGKPDEAATATESGQPPSGSGSWSGMAQSGWAPPPGAPWAQPEGEALPPPPPEDVDGEDIDGEDIDGEALDGEPLEPAKKEEVKIKWASSVESKAKIDSKWEDVSSDEEDDGRKRRAQEDGGRSAKRR